LKKLELVDKKEHEGTQKMLRAAALTYVASVVSSVLNLLRIALMLNGRQNGRRR
jgi:Zn-dependent membrane protease YugP